jgi:predicted RNA-binding Zn-ribbon protein involved in translation (DUF1610 family)
MKMNKVASSNVVAIGHNGKETMNVQYRGDSLYKFEGVSVDAFTALQKAKSVGSSLHKIGIKGTRIPTSKCPECKRSMMIAVDSVSGEVGADHYQCQACGNFEPF